MQKSWYQWYFWLNNSVLGSFNHERRLQPSRPQFGPAVLNDTFVSKANWNSHEPHGNTRGLCIYDDACSVVSSPVSTAQIMMELQLGQYNYKGGMFVSREAYLHGWFEARVKTNEVSCWPAFWMYTAPGHEPWHEVDIMEFQPRNAGNLNIAQHGKDGIVYDNTFNVGNNWHNKWHYYAVWWEPGLLRWYIDDICVGCSCKNVPEVPMIMLLSLEIDADRRPSQLPRKMDIDYVRRYR